MCGIAGQVNSLQPVNGDLVISLTNALAHRGPDDHGFWMDEDKSVAFGHRRLSILDLSQSGRQPMISPDGRFVMVYNGEIYNFAALRNQLEEDGERFRSGTDTEVLLRLWAVDGPRCLLHLRGMFAFAIWDRQERILRLVRDPLGIKPLYFTRSDRSLTFASEIKVLLNEGLDDGLNPTGVGAFLRWGSIPAPFTLYQNINVLPPATCLTWKQADSSTTITSYWDFDLGWRTSRSLTGEVASREAAIEWTRSALSDSVKAHLVSDVPVGAFLSGGVDSTAVVSLMRRAGQNKIKTFSIGSDDPAFNETDYARLAAQTYDTDHQQWSIGAHDFASLRRSFFAALDQPTIDGFNVFVVSKLAHDNGVKVVTSGIGGDEIFRGYDLTFRHLPRLKRLLQFSPRWVRSAGIRAFSSPLSNNRFKHKSRRMISLLYAPPCLSRLYLWARELFTPQDIRNLFRDRDFGNLAADVNMAQFLPNVTPGDASEPAEISMLEVSRYLGSQLLPDSDNFSMAQSLELRVPLVDRLLYEQLISLQDSYFSDAAGTPKSLLVAAVGDVPDSLVRRKKQGFTLPFQTWLSTDSWSFSGGLFNQPLANQVLAETRARRRHWSSLWAMQVLDHFLAGRLN
jgi:asparagine synthase (glutamine-hydrolysing)